MKSYTHLLSTHGRFSPKVGVAILKYQNITCSSTDSKLYCHRFFYFLAFPPLWQLSLGIQAESHWIRCPYYHFLNCKFSLDTNKTINIQLTQISVYLQNEPVLFVVKKGLLGQYWCRMLWDKTLVKATWIWYRN